MSQRFIKYLVIILVACGFALAGLIIWSDNHQNYKNTLENYKNTLADLELITIPKGEMDLEVPIYSFVTTDYVKKHIVFTEPYQIGAYEITIKQWNVCHQAGGCNKPARMRNGETPQHPVTRVSWLDAYNFTNWLAFETGQNFRLPTEEEWTYAAFVGKHYKAEYVEYELGDVVSARPKVTHEKGKFGANAWGMNDIQGNVWEWTLTCWTSSVEGQAKLSNAEELNDPKACGTRFLWGEERAHVPFFVNTTYNGGCATARPASNLGFRIVLAAN
ncbi:MAG: formylglycine-generating enzyme family protein [Rhizobiales bacterium]|nr:formylglycine-generating enzyme family protein [Hyphomicrobiales bacterium]NRB14814.1 formylglycine-generating enzyme family protein [Hyphomicrobiales bacterium]